MLKIALMGAPQSGKTWLARALCAQAESGAATPSLTCNDTTELAAVLSSNESRAPKNLEAKAAAHRLQYDVTLLMGLDLPGTRSEICADQARMDQHLRRGLAQCGIAFHVIYGSGTARLDNALASVNLHRNASPSPGQPGAEETGSAKKWLWVCDKCSDPVCEHRLFVELQARRATVQPA